MSAIGPVSLDEARDVVADRLLTLEVGSTRVNATVASSLADRSRRVVVAFRVVFVAGPGRTDVSAATARRPDAARRRRCASRSTRTLVVQTDRVRTERLLLRLAVGAATDRLWLSYPRLEIAESRPRVPSFYALDVMRAITGRIPRQEDAAGGGRRAGGAHLAWPAPAILRTRSTIWSTTCPCCSSSSRRSRARGPRPCALPAAAERVR